MSWLNVGSLVLGLIAWILPVISLMRYKQGGHKNWAALSAMSVSACATSLYFQIIYNHHLVTINDWSALMDTVGDLVKIGASSSHRYDCIKYSDVGYVSRRRSKVRCRLQNKNLA